MTYPSAPDINVLGLLNGPLVAVGMHAWVANYGYTPSACKDLGALKDVEMAHEIKTTPVEADNVRAVIGSMRGAEELKLSFKLLQYDLQFRSMLSGSSAAGADVVVVDWVTASVDGTATWGRGSVEVDQWFTMQFHMEGLSLTFPDWGGNSGADVYTQADIIIPRCKPTIKTKEAFKKGTQWELPCELEAVYDSTVTTVGTELFKIVLKKPKS
jgi:hypothetical protein